MNSVAIQKYHHYVMLFFLSRKGEGLGRGGRLLCASARFWGCQGLESVRQSLCGFFDNSRLLRSFELSTLDDIVQVFNKINFRSLLPEAPYCHAAAKTRNPQSTPKPQHSTK